jgi:UDP:flavonoid glycosyltransferase YjiC (YdhE family)
LPTTDFNIKILVAPLDWGLGHATRCVPLIRHLCSIGCSVILAADGSQKKLLELEFPDLIIEYLDGYKIDYAKNKRFFSTKIISQLPKILKAIKKEHHWLNYIVKKYNINAIISDNRYGLWHPTLPVAFITHQLTIKTPFTWADGLIRKYNYKFINRFSFCWVPDVEGSPNLAGKLSHPKTLPAIPVKYLGGISRFNKNEVAEEYEVVLVISGPEPQRSLLEQIILNQLPRYQGKALLIRGLPGEDKELPAINNTNIINHLPAKELALAFQKSRFVISRSGYTTVMDIIKLDRKSILIPTPGQTEQEYLAAHLQKQQWCLTVTQDEFNLEAALKKASDFTYKDSGINMELYKNVLNDFVTEVKRGIENINLQA